LQRTGEGKRQDEVIDQVPRWSGQKREDLSKELAHGILCDYSTALTMGQPIFAAI